MHRTQSSALESDDEQGNHVALFNCETRELALRCGAGKASDKRVMRGEQVEGKFH